MTNGNINMLKYNIIKSRFSTCVFRDLRSFNNLLVWELRQRISEFKFTFLWGFERFKRIKEIFITPWLWQKVTKLEPSDETLKKHKKFRSYNRQSMAKQRSLKRQIHVIFYADVLGLIPGWDLTFTQTWTNYEDVSKHTLYFQKEKNPLYIQLII